MSRKLPLALASLFPHHVVRCVRRTLPECSRSPSRLHVNICFRELTHEPMNDQGYLKCFMRKAPRKDR